MPASEDEYVDEASDDDLDDDAPRAPQAAAGRRAAGRAFARETAQNFEVTRTWDLLTEGADGTITSAVEGLLEAGKRKRCGCWDNSPRYRKPDSMTDCSKTRPRCNEALSDT